MTAVRVLHGPAALFERASVWTVSAASLTLNDADNSVAWTFMAPKTGTIDTVGLVIVTRTGTPPAYNVGLVTIDASGYPTTTPFGGSAIESYNFTTTGWVWVTLATPASVTAGDIVTVRVWPGATPPDASNSVRTGCAWQGAVGTIPRFIRYTTAWSYDASMGQWGPWAVRYSDGTIYGVPSTSKDNTAFDSVTSPDEMGCLFQLPFNATCVGVRMSFDTVDASQNIEVRLYDSDGSTVLASIVVTDVDSIAPGVPDVLDFFWSGVALLKNTNYRVTVLATNNTTIGIELWSFTFDAATSRAGVPDGLNWQQTQRTDLGSWTQDNTKFPYMALWLSDIS